MGSLFGGFLALAGEEVWLVDVWQEHIDAINNHGLVLSLAAGEKTARPQATVAAEKVGQCDLIIIFVKSAATPAAAASAQQMLGPQTAVLTLQNGYGNAEKLAGVLGSNRVIAGTTAQGATLLGPGKVLHGGSGDTHIGEFTGQKSDRLNTIAAIFSRAGIPTHPADNVASLIWGKLLVNVGINALTALTGLKNGQLNDYPETKELVRLAVLEAAAVAKAAGITLPYADPVAKVLAIAQATAQNRSSMLQDLSNRRLTEIDAINGAIVREAEKHNLPVPVNQVLTLLVKTCEKIQQGGLIL